VGKTFKRLPISLEKNDGFVTSLILAITVFFFINFFYLGVTTTPEQINESDSLAYHIPLAQSLAKGKFLAPPDLDQGLGYYPAIGESILSFFIIFGIPLNLYNVIGLAVLFISAFKAGKSFGLEKNSSLVFATSIAFIHALLRLMLNQTVDVWLASSFLLSLYFVNEIRNNNRSYLLLGISVGLLSGIKYSGVIFSFAIIAVYFERFRKNLNVKRLLYFLVPFCLFGAFWYIRNFLLKGNPLWPSTFLIWKGDPTFPKFDFYSWNLLGNVIRNPRFLVDFLVALNSEFLLWPTVIFIALITGALKIKNKLVVLGFINFLLFLIFLPYWPGIGISNLRLIASVFIPLILAVFLLFQKVKIIKLVIPISLFNILFVTTELDFHPKLFTATAVIIIYLFFFSKKFLPRIFNL